MTSLLSRLHLFSPTTTPPDLQEATAAIGVWLRAQEDGPQAQAARRLFTALFQVNQIIAHRSAYAPGNGNWLAGARRVHSAVMGSVAISARTEDSPEDLLWSASAVLDRFDTEVRYPTLDLVEQAQGARAIIRALREVLS